MPRFADRIATMPTDELLKEIESIKQEYNQGIHHYDKMFSGWMNNTNNNNEIYEKMCNLLSDIIKQLHRKLDMAMKERYKRDIQETR